MAGQPRVFVDSNVFMKKHFEKLDAELHMF